jgi:hypothetical protein
MKNRQVLAGILAIVFVFGLLLIGCPTDGNDDPSNDNNPLKGTTWKCVENDEEIGEVTRTFVFSDTTVTSTYAYGTTSRPNTGTYSVSDTTVTITIEDETNEGIISGNTIVFGGRTYIKQ